ncbi:DUF1294 domain-containing protein [Alkalihalobacterium elongatum]|uniref:DUF1294 domain-containing protein n=1 Tax=Alkalihalobacterium elongatum TaxID=2675466 RepID=UPI001C1FCB58|nr:DUF1294 domain-containing protein [Alkalihalobacterium elongatum]
MLYIASYFIGINIIGLLLMNLDKRWAIHGKQRIAERTLLVFAILGGSIGVFLGMKQFRHKTRKPKFKFGLPFILIIQATILFLLNKYY